MIRPGGDTLTKKAIDLAKLPSGARVLDIGCGEGETVVLLSEQFGFDATGVDASNTMVAKGRGQYEGIDLRCMEAEFLDFESKTFDAILMECSLSVFRLQEDAVFEAYCLLKPGGKLIITDLFRKNPDPAKVSEMLAAAHEKASRPKVDNDCSKNEKPSFVMLDGAFVLDELSKMIEDIGFEIEHFEEAENALSSFLAQAIMDNGSLGEDFKAFKDPKNLGYFLMIMKKPE